MDRFPEAFERCERVVDVGKLRSYYELALAFQSWAGQKWKGSPRQWEAFDREAKRLGFSPYTSRVRDFERTKRAEAVAWKFEVFNVRGKPQNRYRDQRTGRFIKKP